MPDVEPLPLDAAVAAGGGMGLPLAALKERRSARLLVFHMGTWGLFPGGGQTEKLYTNKNKQTHRGRPFQSANDGWSIPTKKGGYFEVESLSLSRSACRDLGKSTYKLNVHHSQPKYSLPFPVAEETKRYAQKFMWWGEPHGIACETPTTAPSARELLVE